MIDWIATKDRMPTERGEYLLYSAEQDACVGPVPWIPTADGKGGMWCDLFATKEAGASYTPPMVSHWAIWTPPTDAVNG
jgi:hypothetical protein